MESPQPSATSPRKTVLVVDNDPQSLRIVDVSLRRAGFDVRTASDGTAAAESIDRVPPPDLVIADVDLPGLDGFELCRRTKAATRTGAIPFIFLARPHAAHKMRAFELGADDFLAKPVFVKEVIARVEALLQRHERERLSSRDIGADHASGSLADLSTIDLLQSIATNGKSGVLHLRSASGAQGEVYFRRGAVVDAEVGRLSGPDAVYRLLSWTEGRFEIEWRNIRRRDAVALPAPALLMEGMRRLDEWTRLTQHLPPLDTVFEVDYRLLAERLADIPDEVNAILRLFDGVRGAMQVIDDCGLSDLDALTVIGKLTSERLIRNVAAKPADDDKSGPDLEGWLGQGPEAHPAPGIPAPALEPESRLRRANDSPAAARRSTVESSPASDRLFSAPVPEWRERSAEAQAERDDRDTLIGTGEAGLSAFRPDEPAVVIPFPSAPQSLPRQTLVSATGGPVAAVAGEISNGVPTPSAGPPPLSSSPASPALPPVAAAPPPPAGVSIPRSTEPGLGPIPPPPAPPPPLVASPPPAEISSRLSAPALPPPPAELSLPAPAPVIISVPPAPAAPPAAAPQTGSHGRRDSAPRAAELPFDDSAARWMTEGDEIHTHRSRSEALDEMALPSRFRGWALIGGSAIVAVGAVVALLSMRTPPKPEPVAAAPAPAVVAAPIPPPPVPAVPAPAENPAALPGEKAPAPEATAPTTAAAIPAAGAGAEASAGAAPAADFERLLTTCQTAFNGGRMKEATTACAAAVQANPESAKAIALLAHSEFNRSHRKEALSWAEKAIKLDPKLADAYVIIGGVQQDSGRNAEAKSAYRRYLELAPKGQYASDLRAILDSL